MTEFLVECGISREKAVRSALTLVAVEHGIYSTQELSVAIRHKRLLIEQLGWDECDTIVVCEKLQIDSQQLIGVRPTSASASTTSTSASTSASAPVLRKVHFKVEPLNPLESDGTSNHKKNWWDTALLEKLPTADIWGSDTEESSELVDGTTKDTRLAPCMGMWMQGYVGDGEGGQHCRNDCLFGFLRRLSGLNSYYRGYDHADPTATVGRTRSTAITTLNYDNVPLVYIEESETDKTVGVAVQELRDKFCWIPHLRSLPFVFGFAVSKTSLQVFCMNPNNYLNVAPIINIGLTDPEDRLLCLKYFANIARVIKYFILAKYTAPSFIPFNTWTHRTSKNIRLSRRYFENSYNGQDEKYQELKGLYLDIDRLQIPHVEHLFMPNPFDDTTNTIRLQPIGIESRPTTIDELRSALKYVFEFLRGFHAAGYMHCDIRWPNIIRANGDDGQNHDRWVVIDCTEFIRCDAEPAKLLAKSNNIKIEYVFDTRESWSPRHDYYQLGKLILNTKESIIRGTDLQALATRLTDRKGPEISVEEIKTIILG